MSVLNFEEITEQLKERELAKKDEVIYVPFAVDVFDYYIDQDKVLEIADQIANKPVTLGSLVPKSAAESSELFIEDKYLSPYALRKQREKRQRQLNAIRMKLEAKWVLVICWKPYQFGTWVDKYIEAGAKVYIYSTDAGRFIDYEPVEFEIDVITLYSEHDDRESLEDFAARFAEPLGWNFFSSVYTRELGADALDALKPFVSVPYAGQDWYDYKGEEYYKETPIEGASIVEHTPLSKSKLGKGESIQALKEFRDFVVEAIKNKLIPELLEEDWIICSCGNPVRTVGSTEEAGYCTTCDAPIENYRISLSSYYVDYVKSPNTTGVREVMPVYTKKEMYVALTLATIYSSNVSLVSQLIK